MAESVDALDLKSNWAYNPVPVQVWPGAFIKTHLCGSFLVSDRHKKGLLINNKQPFFYILFIVFEVYLLSFSSNQTIFSPRFSMFCLASSSNITSPLSLPNP